MAIAELTGFFSNQIHVPFDELRENTLSQRQREYNEAEEAVAALRAEAQAKDAQRTHAHPSSALFPAPMLQPTDYSSRTIYGPTLASSPPVSRSSRPNMRDSALRGFGRTTTAEEELTSSVVKGRVAAAKIVMRAHPRQIVIRIPRRHTHRHRVSRIEARRVAGPAVSGLPG